MSFVVYLFLQGVIRKYGGKAHTLGYIEILMCAPIFHQLEESRSHTNEWEAERAQPQGARPPLLTNQHECRGLCSTASKDQGKPFNQGLFDPTAHVHLRGLYKQGLWPLDESNPIIH